jgi:uncharacterized protein (TIGR02147 family)
MPSIYNYINFREYLRDFFSEQQQFLKPLTHRAVLKKMDITSTGFLSNVISGKKNINKEMSKKLGKIINLASREQQYLNTMVAYTQAKSIEEKKKYLDRLLIVRKTDLAYMRDDQLSIFSKWYYVFIRDVLCFIDFKDDYAGLAARLDPPIKPEEAQSAVRDLEKLGFIAKDSAGAYRPCDHLVSTGDEVHSVQLANFQLTTMDMAKRSLEKHPPAMRDISFVSLTLAEESFGLVKSEVQAFRKRLLLIAKDEQNPDRLCQCNIQLFPVTKQPGGGNVQI